MSTFARAAARAAGAVEAPALAPAQPSASPLAQVDQRLNLPEFLSAFEQGAVGLPASAEVSAFEPVVPEAALPAAPSRAEPISVAVLEPSAAPRPSPVVPAARSAERLEPISRERPEGSVQPGLMSRALAAVDGWLRAPEPAEVRELPESALAADRPRPPVPERRPTDERRVRRPRDLDVGFEVRDPVTHGGRRAEPVQRVRPQAPAVLVPHTAQSAAVSQEVVVAPPPAPVLKIGRIDVRVVRPVEPRPVVRQTTQRSSVAARSMPAPAAAPPAFGWRQR